MSAPNTATRDETDAAGQLERQTNKIKSIQISPVKNIFMTAFMMWMAGNEIHIFSIMITGMAIYQPLQGLMQVGSIFKIFEGKKELETAVLIGKVLYTLSSLAALCAGLLKLSYMGLLPTATVDWISHTVPYPIETVQLSVL